MSRLDAAFRFDADARIGYGHAIRSTAVADAFASVGWRTRALVGPSSRASAAVPSNAVEAADASAAASALPDGCEYLFVDNYAMDEAAIAAFRPWAQHIVVLEDVPTRRLDCDYLVDPTPGRAAGDYAGLVPPAAALLLGPAFAALRPPFLRRRAEALARRAHGRVSRVLVAVGGADASDATTLYLEALREAGIDAAVDVVLGEVAPHRERVAAFAQRAGWRLHVGVSAEQMAERMVAADLALAAPSSASWERCCLGLPSVTVTTADNQRDVEAALVGARAAVSLGRQAALAPTAVAAAICALAADPQGLQAMASRAEALCDGRGVWRLLCALVGAQTVRNGRRIALRPADERDCARVYAWNCEPGARRFFRNPEIPARPAHDAWFARTATFESRLLFVGESDGMPVGTLRFDRSADRAAPPEISLLVGQSHRGNGFGAAMLELGSRLYRSRPLSAHIQAGNAASQRTFAAAGFAPTAHGADMWELAA